jgi:hypothetical protein
MTRSAGIGTQIWVDGDSVCLGRVLHSRPLPTFSFNTFVRF